MAGRDYTKNMSPSKNYPLIVNLYLLTLASYRFFKGVTWRMLMFLKSCLVGFWLGVFSQRTLHFIDEIYYNTNEIYGSEDHNHRGLFAWEKQVIHDYFKPSQRILLLGAGGGREIAALRSLGYEIDGFECNPQLVERANRLLKKANLVPDVRWAPRDQSPQESKKYDALIIGWGVYTLIAGKQQRIKLLKQLRDQIREEGPLLLSFFHRQNPDWQFKVVVAIGNISRRLLGREHLDLGDVIDPNYQHYFTREEILAELTEGGFNLQHYSTQDYGHAVGIAK